MSDMLFEWDDLYLTGIEELDHEHKKLIGDINRLHDELIQQSERSQISKALGNIETRMRAHFALEEHFMKDRNYEFFEEHKNEHERLLDWYTEYVLQYLDDTRTSSRNSIEEILRYWVLKHISESDKKMSLMAQKK